MAAGIVVTVIRLKLKSVGMAKDLNTPVQNRCGIRAKRVPR